MGQTIKKLANNNVEVTNSDPAVQAFTLMPNMSVFRDKSRNDGVKVQSTGVISVVLKAAKVDNVVRQDATNVPIADGDTLYSELKEYFFNR